MQPLLEGKRALITGVGRKAGIGYALCECFAQHGADIFYTYWNPYDADLGLVGSETDAASFADILCEYGTSVHGFALDLSLPDGPEKLFAEMIQIMGAPDILIHNACYSTNQPFADVTAELLDRHYFVNVRATLLLCKAFVSDFSATKGYIVNLTSGQSISIMEGELPYTITKAGVDMLTKQLAPELVSKNITLFAVDPGPTDTGWMSRAVKDAILQDSEKGSITKPSEVADFILEKITSNEDMAGLVLHVPR